jgi:phage recombination protein Bet
MSNALTTLTHKLASRFDMGDGTELIQTLKATVFKGQVTDAQMTALMVVANQYGLNPWTKEIYAFPDKNNSIIPVVGVDGWCRIINSHEMFDGMEFEQNDESCTCVMFRKDRSHAIKVTEYMSECKRTAQGPWQTHPRRMLRHKAMIQCARLAFGFGGIYDQDEAERIAESEAVTQSLNTSRSPQAAAGMTPPEDLADFEAQHLDNMRNAAMNGEAALSAAFQALPRGPHKVAFWQKHQADLKKAAQAAVVVDAVEVQQ